MSSPLDTKMAVISLPRMTLSWLGSRKRRRARMHLMIRDTGNPTILERKHLPQGAIRPNPMVRNSLMSRCFVYKLLEFSLIAPCFFSDRRQKLAPTCRLCLIRDDLTTVWCEVTSSIRDRSLDEEGEEKPAAESAGASSDPTALTLRSAQAT